MVVTNLELLRKTAFLETMHDLKPPILKKHKCFPQLIYFHNLLCSWRKQYSIKKKKYCRSGLDFIYLSYIPSRLRYLVLQGCAVVKKLSLQVIANYYLIVRLKYIFNNINLRMQPHDVYCKKSAHLT